MDNPCPAYIGCAGDCNECNYKEKVMDKCKEKYCHWQSPVYNDNCSYYKSISECNGKPAIKGIMKQLQAELKLYKRVADLACEALSDPACAELRANIFNDSQPPCVDPSKCCAECWKEYLITKAKEANK